MRNALGPSTLECWLNAQAAKKDEVQDCRTSLHHLPQFGIKALLEALLEIPVVLDEVLLLICTETLLQVLPNVALLPLEDFIGLLEALSDVCHHMTWHAMYKRGALVVSLVMCMIKSTMN